MEDLVPQDGGRAPALDPQSPAERRALEASRYGS
jgi:hypothetical protein